jgi:hypothetical protein
MSKIFRRRHSNPRLLLDQSAYSSLLDPSISAQEQPGGHSRGRTTPADYQTRPWLAAAESRPSWTGERPPTRKLVKDMNGSSRPSFSLEISNSDTEKERGVVRRQLARLMELYRREK